MKVNILLFVSLVCFSLILFSCGNDDEVDIQPTTELSALHGKWKAERRKISNCSDPSLNADESCGTHDFCFTLNFLSDSTYTEIPSGGVESDIKPYNANPNEGLIGMCLEYKGCSAFTYIIKGNTLEFSTISSNSCYTQLIFEKIN